MLIHIKNHFKHFAITDYLTIIHSIQINNDINFDCVYQEKPINLKLTIVILYTSTEKEGAPNGVELKE